MDSTSSKVCRAEAGTSGWKGGSWEKKNCLEKQKVWNDADLKKLEVKIISLTGSTAGKIDGRPQNRTLGHARMGQSQLKQLRVGVSEGEKTSPEEQIKIKEAKECRNEVLQKDLVTLKRFAKGSQLDASYKLSESRSGHPSRVFLPKKAQPASRPVSSSGSNPGELSVNDYLVLLKSLRINLPSGVLNTKAIMLSQDTAIIQKAQYIIKELENFKLQFNSIPRLGCREIKNALSMKDNNKVLEITQMIFFEKRDGPEKNLKAQWEKNVSNTNCGFRFRDKYKTMAISTPAMYATTQTRSWKNVEVGDNVAKISAGVTVNVRDIENRDYCDESALWTTSSLQKFGKYFQNPADEQECLKFYHELRETGTNSRVRYTKCNKVDFGFLSGRLDFLADVKVGKCEKMLIECKGTTGDMVGKVFTKPKNGGRRANLNETHGYCYQVQAYMYILHRAAKQTQSFTSDRAVMVIRHYHKNGREPQDFYWNYLGKNEEIQLKIDELRIFCEEEVLACFLATLNLIFQKDT